MRFVHGGVAAECAQLDAFPENEIQYKGLEEGKSFLFIVVNLTALETAIGEFRFSTMPGCCGVVVSHGLYLYEAFQGIGYAAQLQALREHIARELGYSAMIATVLTDNFPEVISSAKARWKLGPAFTNSRSKNQVAFQIKLLK